MGNISSFLDFTVNPLNQVDPNDEDSFLVPEPEIIEDAKPLRDSILWDLQTKYYNGTGPMAWISRTVPMFASSNSYMAGCYVKIIMGLLQDMASVIERNQEPLYILEIGAGHGRLGYLIVEQLLRFSAFMPKLKSGNPPFVYIFSDSVEQNITSLRSHMSIQTLVEKGCIDFAFWNAEADLPLFLLNANRTLNLSTLSCPLVAVANYVFDTLRQDAFLIEGGILRQVTVTLLSNRHEGDYSDPSLISRVDLQWGSTPLPFSLPPLYSETTGSELPADMPEAYRDPIILSILRGYAHSAGLGDRGLLTIPLGAFKLMRILLRRTCGRLLMLAADKGYSSLAEMAFPVLSGSSVPGTIPENSLGPSLGNSWPRYSVHGSLSFSVNFHALRRLAAAEGGFSLQTPNADGLKVAAFFFGSRLRARPGIVRTLPPVLFSTAPQYNSGLLGPVALALQRARLCKDPDNRDFQFTSAVENEEPSLSHSGNVGSGDDADTEEIRSRRLQRGPHADEEGEHGSFARLRPLRNAPELFEFAPAGNPLCTLSQFAFQTSSSEIMKGKEPNGRPLVTPVPQSAHGFAVDDMEIMYPEDFVSFEKEHSPETEKVKSQAYDNEALPLRGSAPNGYEIAAAEETPPPVWRECLVASQRVLRQPFGPQEMQALQRLVLEEVNAHMQAADPSATAFQAASSSMKRGPSLRLVLALLRACGHDAEVFHKYKQIVIEGVAELTAAAAANATANPISVAKLQSSHAAGAYGQGESALGERPVGGHSNVLSTTADAFHSDLQYDLEFFLASYFPLGPQHDICFDLARVCMAMRAYGPAIDLFMRSISICGDHYITWHNIGICHFFLNNYELAEQAFLKSLALDDGYLESKNWLMRTREAVVSKLQGSHSNTQVTDSGSTEDTALPSSSQATANTSDTHVHVSNENSNSDASARFSHGESRKAPNNYSSSPHVDSNDIEFSNVDIETPSEGAVGIDI